MRLREEERRVQLQLNEPGAHSSYTQAGSKAPAHHLAGTDSEEARPGEERLRLPVRLHVDDARAHTERQCWQRDVASGEEPERLLQEEGWLPALLRLH